MRGCRLAVPAYLCNIVYEMAKRELIGGFELLVLLALIRLGDDAYG